MVTKLSQDQMPTNATIVDVAQNVIITNKESSTNKNASGGYVGLTLFKINFINAANTFVSYLVNTATAARTYTFRNRNFKVGERLNNFSTTDQTINSATSALLAGSLISIPDDNLEIGTVFKWVVSVSKTAAGTAANTFFVRIGTTGTVSDAAILTFALPTGTAIVDTAFIELIVTIRGPLSASCIAQGLFILQHNLASTGFTATTAIPIIRATSSGFNATTAGLYASLSCTTAASTVLTFQQVVTDVINL